MLEIVGTIIMDKIRAAGGGSYDLSKCNELGIDHSALLKEITITFELVPMKQAGRILYIPIILSLIRQLTFALKSLKRGVILRNEQQFFFKLVAECLDILLLQKGLTLTKSNKFNELAYLSQPNLHYRWKKKNP